MTDLAISALTDVILACQYFFLAGLTFRAGLTVRSAGFAFAGHLFLAGFATMLGAIDHGFFEPISHPAHPGLKVLTRVVLLLAALSFLLMAVRAYLPPKAGRIVLWMGVAVVAVAIAAIAQTDNFFIVLGVSGAVLLLVLVLSARAFFRGDGSPLMPLGVVLTVAAGTLPIFGVEVAGLGLYGTLHVAAMPAVLVLYLGGRSLPSHAPGGSRAP